MFESHSRQLHISKKKWAVLSAVELFAVHLLCCSSMIHAMPPTSNIESTCEFGVCLGHNEKQGSDRGLL